MSRFLLTVIALVALAATSGCAAFDKWAREDPTPAAPTQQRSLDHSPTPQAPVDPLAMSF